MSCLKIILLIHVALATGAVLLFLAVLNDKFPPMPDMPEVPEKWFGPGKRIKEDESIRPFQIKVDDKVT